MKILIHQSICGEVNKAWGLIKTTLPDIGIAKNIAFRTDLQDQTSGIHWDPAIRGFSEGNYFLIMKTFEDTSPDVRRGRKFSHVLIISKKDIEGIDNIEQIINLLPENIDKDTVLEPLSLELVPSTCRLSPKIQGRFNKLIKGYITIKNFKNTLIWIGQENFDVAVIELWKRLAASERQNFQFGITFNNDNKEKENISLFSVPESVQSKFIRSDFFAVAKNDNHKPTELIEQWLIGDAVVQQRIQNFEKAVESNSISRGDINLIAKGIDTFEQVDSIKDLKKLSTLSHLIAQYAPSNDQGKEFKEQLLNKIIQLTEIASFSDLIVLRNFKIESFKNSKKLLTKAFTTWIGKYIFSVSDIYTNYKPFFEHIKTSNLNWWDKVIEQELKLYIGTIQVSKVSVIYAWLAEFPSLLTSLDSLIDKSKDSEKCFIKKIPEKIPQDLIEELKLFSLNNHWFRLYAQLLNAQFELKEALTELIKIDQDETHFEAINIIITGKNQKFVLDYAIDTGEVRMLKIAGKICHASPKYLAQMDILNDNWKSVWLEAIENGNSVAKGLNEPDKKIYKLFDSLISGNPVSERLLNKISQSEFGDILSYSNRSELWERFPASVRNNFLAKTSATFFKQSSEKLGVNIQRDRILLDYINHKGIYDFLDSNKKNIINVIPLFENFSQLSDNLLKDYINDFSGSINAIEARQLGKLIVKRRFSNSAYLVYSKASKANNWRFALAECYHLLDFITKCILKVSGILSNIDINPGQWWQSAEELIVELYPNGTSLTTVWKKAGGKESDLLTKGTSSEIWNDAIYKLRKGKFKDITMNSLFKEIKKQYEDNQKFKILYELRKNYLNEVT